MSIHLKSLAFTRRGDNGWTAGPYDFSRGITVLEGPNGAGKTPMLKGIAYCLGHPISLPPDVLIRCKSIILELENDGAVITIERAIHLDFSAVISRKDVDDRQFENVRDFSGYLLCSALAFPNVRSQLATPALVLFIHVLPRSAILGRPCITWVEGFV